MVFQRSECSSYHCDGSFRKLCRPTCICAFTTLPMVTAHVPMLCTLSAMCPRLPRRCCSCVYSQRWSTRCQRFQRSRWTERVQNPENKWVALGACHALNALNAGIFFPRWCSSNVYVRQPPIFTLVKVSAFPTLSTDGARAKSREQVACVRGLSRSYRSEHAHSFFSMVF
jgi:hypothetical protein